MNRELLMRSNPTRRLRATAKCGKLLIAGTFKQSIVLKIILVSHIKANYIPYIHQRMAEAKVAQAVHGTTIKS